METRPGVRILGYFPAGKRLARVEMDVVHTVASNKNPELVGKEIINLFQNKIVPVKNSFLSNYHAGRHQSLSGFITANREIVVWNDEVKHKFKAMSANLYADAENNMWILNNDSDGKFAVRANGVEEDAAMYELIEKVCSGQMSLSSENVRAAKQLLNERIIRGGDLVHYVSGRNSRLGFVIATGDDGEVIVLDKDAKDSEIIDKNAVVGKLPTDEVPEPEMSEEEKLNTAISSARGTLNLTRLIEYYQRIYAYSPDYFNLLKRNIEQHCFM